MMTGKISASEWACRWHLRDVIHTSFNVQSCAGSVDSRVKLANWLMAVGVRFQEGPNVELDRSVNELNAMNLAEPIRLRALRHVTDRDLAGMDALATHLFCDFLRHPGEGAVS